MNQNFLTEEELQEIKLGLMAQYRERYLEDQERLARRAETPPPPPPAEPEPVTEEPPPRICKTCRHLASDGQPGCAASPGSEHRVLNNPGQPCPTGRWEARRND